jgi:hypothetical protein
MIPRGVSTPRQTLTLNIVNKWKNYVSQFLIVHNVSNVRQIEVHTAETLVLGFSRLQVEIAIAKHKSPVSDQIVAELIQVEDEHYCLRSINSFFLFGIKNCRISGRSLLLYQFTKWVTILTNNYHGIPPLSTSYNILSNILLPRLSLYID